MLVGPLDVCGLLRARDFQNAWIHPLKEEAAYLRCFNRSGCWANDLGLQRLHFRLQRGIWSRFFANPGAAARYSSSLLLPGAPPELARSPTGEAVDVMEEFNYVEYEYFFEQTGLLAHIIAARLQLGQLTFEGEGGAQPEEREDLDLAMAARIGLDAVTKDKLVCTGVAASAWQPLPSMAGFWQPLASGLVTASCTVGAGTALCRGRGCDGHESPVTFEG
ncbi:unnamed protein product [Effrenium voratum]|nr:unnamed protein product [Effrenium voratum]